ncbi:bifunctional diguanylate cyclase/phosphodiesterase [Actinotalea sp. K2]|uniref:putative bifunctional diguanylate cyclase/phosphodiesterase n=1 Tax=Actinotalea sp. K2 TaxID=2939438 RepID=UPI002016FFD8|nr:bifunctional diguanylate cyclase/phosphodiesterase [Actinotalea sp. K2]MCL3861155.1 EAL domain-containing protein [Actinotalea sp. K2]
MVDGNVCSPHRLVEFLTALSRCLTTADAVRNAAELVAEEFDAEVGAVVLGGVLTAVAGFGQRPVPSAALTAMRPGTGVIELDSVGRCQTLAARWTGESEGRLLLARTGEPFTAEDRDLLLGMAGAMGMTLDMIGVLERERGRHRVLEVLLDIQRSISHRAPLATILAAVTDGASTVLEGCPVSLVLDDALERDRPLAVGTDLVDEGTSVSVQVHIEGIPAGALVATSRDGAPIGPGERSLLTAFAEHASLALTDARTVEAMQEAYHDSLTGLPNRALFLERVSSELRSDAPHRSWTTVLFIDLDRFKAVNDSLGHAAGDALLREVSDRIRACTRTDATAARFGGDEFAVLLTEQSDSIGAVVVAERIIAALREPFTIHGKGVLVCATIGIAHADHATVSMGSAADELLGNADLAMYQAKAAGGSRVLTYEPQMRVALLARLELQAELQGALGRGELFVVYQPIVELDSGRTCGLEALLRWRHPSRGIVAPLDFIPIAETTGVIVAIGRWVLDEACHRLAGWRRLEPDLTMNVNVSVHQLRDPAFVDAVDHALRAAGLPGQALVLEITESVLIDDVEVALTSLRALKGLGVAIALDDFGTGFSSLGYLHRFPVDILKIDRSFVSGPASETDGHQLVRMIIELGRAYGVEVIAEGIEDELQRDRLLGLGCRRGQGFHFARPGEVSQVEAFVTAPSLAGAAPPGPA